MSFDQQQFAYLRNRRTTHALLVLVEKLKSGLLAGKKAGVVFFDFADAFGSVDRDCLLVKVGRDLGISGKLVLHIRRFLSDRFARIKANGLVGEWIESFHGTSAGTRLGPLLFIMYMHDVPKCIYPKFADDLVAIAIRSDLKSVVCVLQHAVDEFVSWSREWGGAQRNKDKSNAIRKQWWRSG